MINAPSGRNVSPAPTKTAAKDKALNVLGFSIFDAIHIALSIFFLVSVIGGRNVALDSGEVQSDVLLEMADEFTELIISMLLIFFIAFIFRAKSDETQMVFYSFAWLILSIGLLIPATFEIPSLYIYNHSALGNIPEYVLRNANLFLPGFAFVLFAVALFYGHNAKKWRRLLTIGVLFIILFVATSVSIYTIEETLNQTFFSNPLQTVFRYCFLLSPLIPSVLTLLSLRYLIEKGTKEKENARR